MSRTVRAVDATKQEATNVLEERTSFTFTVEEWAGLNEALDAPVKADERKKVARLLGEKPLWEQGK